MSFSVLSFLMAASELSWRHMRLGNFAPLILAIGWNTSRLRFVFPDDVVELAPA